MSIDKTKSVNLIDILIVLAKKKLTILLITFIVSAFSVAYVMLVSEYWVSRAAIRPVSDNNQSMNLSNALMGLGSSFLGTSMTTTSADFVAIMNSRTFSEDVVKHFNLDEYFNISEEDSLQVIETATKFLLEEVMKYSVSPETGIIYISAETKDRILSKQIVDYYIKKIEMYNKSTQKSKGRQKRIFLEKRVIDIEENITIIKKRLQNFQQQSNVLEIDSQIRGAVELYSNLIKKRLEIELQLATREDMFSSNSPSIQGLETSLDELNKRLSELENGEDFTYMLGFKNIPKLANSYSDLITQLEINLKLYEFIYPQLESAKLEEIKDLPTLEIIDSGSIAGYRSKPKRGRFCVIMFILAILGSSFVITVNHLTPEIQKRKIKEFWRILFLKK